MMVLLEQKLELERVAEMAVSVEGIWISIRRLEEKGEV